MPSPVVHPPPPRPQILVHPAAAPVVVARVSDHLNRRMRTRTYGGVGRAGANPALTRLWCDLRVSEHVSPLIQL